MKLLIAGSRSIAEYGLIDALLWDMVGISEIVSGCARGADQLGEAWAARNGILVRRFPADWDRFGRAAGFYRNADMAAYCDCGMILWDGMSVGTVDMIDKLRRAGKPYEVWDDLGQLVGTQKLRNFSK